MENSHEQILSEIRFLLSSIKTQLEVLENKITEYQKVTEVCSAEVAEAEEVISTVEEPEVVEVEVMDIELDPSDDLPFYDTLPVTEAADYDEDLPAGPDEDIVAQPEETQVESVEDSVEVSVQEDVEIQEKVDVQEKLPVIDVMTAKQAWRTDMPGSPVKDIRSAISLHERILFINYLFDEDPLAFQEMLTQLNAMASFDEAAAHAIAAHPEWDLESDTVYRFMMALRRRHQ